MHDDHTHGRRIPMIITTIIMPTWRNLPHDFPSGSAEAVKADMVQVYGLIAEAEAAAHGKTGGPDPFS